MKGFDGYKARGSLGAKTTQENSREHNNWRNEWHVHGKKRPMVLTGCGFVRQSVPLEFKFG